VYEFSEKSRRYQAQLKRFMGEVGAHEARNMIAASKMSVPLMVQNIIDRCMQMHGAGGLRLKE
jgi:acyl-CoA dehydrogenase